MLDIVPGSCDKAVNKAYKSLYPHGVNILVETAKTEQVIKYCGKKRLGRIGSLARVAWKGLTGDI